MTLMLGHFEIPVQLQLMVYWAMFPVVTAIAFARFKLYSSLWRFASSYDFLNIAFAVTLVATLMFAVKTILVYFDLVFNFDNRAFIIFALLLSVFVSLSRLAYRFLSDWTFASVRSQDKAPPKSAIFVGSIPEAALAIRELQANDGNAPRIGVIIAPNQNDTLELILPVSSFGAT
ncbi:MAG: hypothetical protein U5K75_09650 [Ahrensia sp.]|nr:hypothetical protein [Ahrensia sp.]